MIQWFVGALLKPFTVLGEKFLDNQRDVEKLRHGTERVALTVDQNIRQIKLGTLLGQIPLFVAESSAALYVAAIFIDSTFPSAHLNPLELPAWFLPYFNTVMYSIFGLGAVKYTAKNWNRK
jgi:hypothetical protein